MKKYFEEPVIELIRIADVITTDDDPLDELPPSSGGGGGIL